MCSMTPPATPQRVASSQRGAGTRDWKTCRPEYFWCHAKTKPHRKMLDQKSAPARSQTVSCGPSQSNKRGRQARVPRAAANTADFRGFVWNRSRTRPSMADSFALEKPEFKEVAQINP